MDNQNKKQKSPTNKHLEKKTNSPSSLAWRSLKEDKSWMGKLVLSSMHAKTWRGGKHQFGIEKAMTTSKGCKNVLETKGAIVALWGAITASKGRREVHDIGGIIVALQGALGTSRRSKNKNNIK